jgi:hypothetical protein
LQGSLLELGENVLDSTFLLLFCINIIFDLTNDHDFFDRGLVITTKNVIKPMVPSGLVEVITW